jgi:hypothetical protein
LGIVEPAILISKSLAMKSLYSWFVYVLIGLFSIALCFFYPAIAQADYLDLYPQAQLIGSDPKATLEIYGSPGRQQPAIAKAEVGDRVRVIEQAYDNDGNRWDRVQLLESSQIEGWISEELIKLQDTFPNTPRSNPYFQINQSSQGKGWFQNPGNFTTQFSPQEQIHGNGINQYSQ